MILSRACNYGLQAVLHLARHDGRPLLCKEISQALNIPQHFLAKILQDLSRRSLLQSFKGRGGGFKLARSPDAITFKDVLLAVDAFPISERCAFGWGKCNATSPCPLHGPWKAISEEFSEWAAKTTFAELGALSHSALRRYGVG